MTKHMSSYTGGETQLFFLLLSLAEDTPVALTYHLDRSPNKDGDPWESRLLVVFFWVYRDQGFLKPYLDQQKKQKTIKGSECTQEYQINLSK